MGVARYRARLRCLRMTVNNRRLYRSLDSATRNDFLGGNYGAYILGKENTTPGISGSQGNLEWLGECVGSLRGLNRIRGLVAWLMVATLLSPRWGLSVCGFLTHGLRRGLCSVAATRLFSVPRFAALLCRRFAAIHGRLEPRSGVRMQPTAQAVGKNQEPTSPSRGERS